MYGGRSEPIRGSGPEPEEGDTLKKTMVLNRELSAAIAGMGHTDLMLIADAAHPIPRGVERIDLALRPGMPGTVDVLETILSELSIEGYYVAAEMEEASPGIWAACGRILAQAPRTIVPHAEFKAIVPTVRYAIRTGEYSAFANLILVAGIAGVGAGT